MLEFYPIVLRLYLWGHQMQNHFILFLTDNEALVYIINKQSSKDKNLMFFVRKLVLICSQNNILFKAKHVRGVYNTLADFVLITGGYIQAFGPNPQGAGANRHSCASAASELAPVISTLLQSNLQPSSLPTYQWAWKLFSQFLHAILPSVSTTLPISPLFWHFLSHTCMTLNILLSR